MNLLIADKFETLGINGLKDLGMHLEYDPELSGQDLQKKLVSSSADILVVRSTKVTKEIIDPSSLSLIIRAGAGYDTIDVKYAQSKGIKIANCPGKNSVAVAELTMGLILAIDRHIPDNVLSLREGKWNKRRFSQAKGLYGRTLGIIGSGKIALEVMQRAKAFGMNVLLLSHWLTQEQAESYGASLVPDLEHIARNADIVSVHTSLTNQTRGLIGQKFFDMMKQGAYFINTSRAEIVDHEALEKALSVSKIFAGLDVFEGELSAGEGEYQGNLQNFKNVYCTHHIGASTEQAQEAVALEVVRIAKEFLANKVVLNAVSV